jgi:hypothetical protein
MNKNQTAVIDSRDIFIGMYPMQDDIPEGARRLNQIKDCDLPAGRYRWDGKSFLPLRLDNEGRLDREPDLIQAIYLVFKTLENGGTSLPPQAKQWMAWYESTIDVG